MLFPVHDRHVYNYIYIMKYSTVHSEDYLLTFVKYVEVPYNAEGTARAIINNYALE